MPQWSCCWKLYQGIALSAHPVEQRKAKGGALSTESALAGSACQSPCSGPAPGPESQWPSAPLVLPAQLGGAGPPLRSGGASALQPGKLRELSDRGCQASQARREGRDAGTLSECFHVSHLSRVTMQLLSGTETTLGKCWVDCNRVPLAGRWFRFWCISCLPSAASGYTSPETCGHWTTGRACSSPSRWACRLQKPTLLKQGRGGAWRPSEDVAGFRGAVLTTSRAASLQ